ncbi:MAG TPA: NAD-dependent epimerase/dehydratase family protein [Trueperaceae bacterium]
MNWLITGGCGFIGTSLIKNLLEQGNEGIRVVDDLSVGSRSALSAVAPHYYEGSGRLAPGDVQLLVADILDEEMALAAAEGIDVIVHLAANTGVQPSIADPRNDCLTNVIGTLNYLEAARLGKLPRFVFASSGGTVIGDCAPPVHEELVPHPKSPYGASKSAGEGYLSAYHGSFGLEGVALRFGNVYGPGSSHKNSVVARFVRRAMAGEPLEIYGDGRQTRDYIFIRDLVAAIRLAATTPGVGGKVFQIATGCETTVNELAEMLIPILASRGFDAQVRHAAPLPGEIRRNFADTSRARELLGWSPRTALAKGLEETVDWFLNDARQ